MSIKSFRPWLRRHVAPWLLHRIYRSLHATWRVTLEEPESLRQAMAERRPVIMAHWHGDELAVIHLAAYFRIATITSTSKDGALIDELLHRLGAVTARGSSSKGGANALRGLVQLCRKGGYNVSFAVDGPKGPIYQVKPGVFEFSRLMDAPIYAVSVGVSRPWIFRRSWNKAVLPGFFSRIHVRIVDCLPPVTRGVDPRSPELAQQLKSALDDGRKRACAEIGVERP